MISKFDTSVQDAVRKAGPDALPSRVYEEIIGRDASFLRTLFGPSLARVMSSLHSLSERGLLTETTIVDQQGRNRKAYSTSEVFS